jgi:hypothetical protein
VAAPLRLALLALLTLAPGCATQEVDATAKLLLRPPGGGGRAASGPGDRYIGVRGKKKVAGSEAPVAFARVTPDVWAPFDVSIRTGFFDPAQMATADGTRACLEIDDVDFTVFYDVCATWSAAQSAWTLGAFTGQPVVTLPGALALSGLEIELRIETDGATLRFHGRPAGAAAWSLVAETPWPGQGERLEAAFGVSPILKGTLVGFDDPSFASAPPPDLPMGADAVAAAANEALLEGLGAFLALDGASPDFPAATARLEAAADALADARTLLDSLAQDRTTKKAGRDLAKGAKRLARAQDGVAGQDADRALLNLGKAGAAVEKAVLRLVPQPLGGP